MTIRTIRYKYMSYKTLVRVESRDMFNVSWFIPRPETQAHVIWGCALPLVSCGGSAQTAHTDHCRHGHTQVTATEPEAHRTRNPTLTAKAPFYTLFVFVHMRMSGMRHVSTK